MAVIAFQLDLTNCVSDLIGGSRALEVNYRLGPYIFYRERVLNLDGKKFALPSVVVLQKVDDPTRVIPSLNLKDPLAMTLLLCLKHEKVFEQSNVRHNIMTGANNRKTCYCAMQIGSELGRKDPKLMEKDGEEGRKGNGEATSNRVQLDPEPVAGTGFEDTFFPGNLVWDALLKEIGNGDGIRGREGAGKSKENFRI